MMRTQGAPLWFDEIKINPSNPEWFTNLRAQHWHAFLSQGVPDRKVERFKYTDLTFLNQKKFHPAKRGNVAKLHDAIDQHRLRSGESIVMVFVNGYFMPALSDLHKLPAEVIACGMAEALLNHEESFRQYDAEPVDAQQYPFASLNASQWEDGLYLELKADCELSAPLHLLSLTVDKEEFIAHPHHLIILGENSRLTFFEEPCSEVEQSYLINTVSTIVVGKGAKLNHFKLQQEGKQAIHMAHTFVYQKRDSSAMFTHISRGAIFARDDVVIQLQEEGAECKTSGFYRLRLDNQYIDHHIDINHLAPRSYSEMLYKGILDTKARAVFNGRLYVSQGAQKIVAYQANHNLLLSKEAEVYAKPELEIYADDVKCKHGASTGQIDEEAIFYLRSRGIERHEAINMLLQGFADEIFARIDHAGILLRALEAM